MNELVSLLVFGLASAAIYAVAASGLVVTYTTSGIFNFAHGAVAMCAAFVYWQLSSPDAWGLPVRLALVADALRVRARRSGSLIDRVLMRRLHDAVADHPIVVPIGLLVALIQLATVIWPPPSARQLPRFFEGDVVADRSASASTTTSSSCSSSAIAGGRRPAAPPVRHPHRRGHAGRGRQPRPRRAQRRRRPTGSRRWRGRSAARSPRWPASSSPRSSRLDQTQLTLLVINAYAAAMVGRLRSLPLTALGRAHPGPAPRGAPTHRHHASARTEPARRRWTHTSVDTSDRPGDHAVRRPARAARRTRPSLFDRAARPQPGARTRRWRTVSSPSRCARRPRPLVVPSLDARLGARRRRATAWPSASSPSRSSRSPGYAGQISLAPLAFAGIGAAGHVRSGGATATRSPCVARRA